LEIKWN